jgi:hypothetical protein
MDENAYKFFIDEAEDKRSPQGRPKHKRGDYITMNATKGKGELDGNR